MRPTEDTVRLIWEGVIGAEIMSRDYGYVLSFPGQLGWLLIFHRWCSASFRLVFRITFAQFLTLGAGP